MTGTVRRGLVCAALGWGTTWAYPQERAFALEPVHWSAEAALPRAAGPGARFPVVLHAAIDPGWHLYALQERDGAPLATEIALAKTGLADLLRVEQERPQHSLDPDSHTMTAWFAQSATFTLRLAATGPQRVQNLTVLVRYQACNDRLCLPPKDVAVPVLFTRTR